MNVILNVHQTNGTMNYCPRIAQAPDYARPPFCPGRFPKLVPFEAKQKGLQKTMPNRHSLSPGSESPPDEVQRFRINSHPLRPPTFLRHAFFPRNVQHQCGVLPPFSVSQTWSSRVDLLQGRPPPEPTTRGSPPPPRTRALSAPVDPNLKTQENRLIKSFEGIQARACIHGIACHLDRRKILLTKR
jgi:hypothetical protein